MLRFTEKYRNDVHYSKHTNTIIMATTNYPEDLDDRIINRPSRFDRIEQIGMPSAGQRKIYLIEKSKSLSLEQIDQWVEDTDDFTLAHLKELILGVEVFDISYDEILTRLKSMRKKEASSSDYQSELRGKSKLSRKGGGVGFN